jgi:hypothetical protein
MKQIDRYASHSEAFVKMFWLSHWIGYGIEWLRQPLTGSGRRFVQIENDLLQNADGQALVQVVLPPLSGVRRPFVHLNDDGTSVVERIPELQEAMREKPHSTPLHTIDNDVTSHRLFRPVPTCCQLQFLL